MSVDGTKLQFEGFLQKRKDTLRSWWVTYWFRLQNTTLFFYTERNCSASHLRGSYYMYTVQSVRLIHTFDPRRFVFEIVMANGKRKVLAAQTASLRSQWVDLLWRSMHLSCCWSVDSTDTHTHTQTPPLPAPPLPAPPLPDPPLPDPPSFQPEVKNCEVDRSDATYGGVGADGDGGSDVSPLSV